MYIFFFCLKHFSGLLQVQKHCGAEVISCVGIFFNFRGVLQVQKHCSARVISQKTVTYRVGNVQRGCSFTFCRVLEVQKHCSARVNSSMYIFFSFLRVCKYILVVHDLNTAK